MNEDNPDNHEELSRVGHGALAKDSAVAHVDLDALVREGKRLRSRKDKGMTGDNLVAFKLFSKAAEAGHVEAQYYLGLCYLYGDGIEQDNTKALTLLERSASAGFVNAMICLAAQYLTGRHFPKNEDAAIKWFQKAADTGSETACMLLAITYRDRKDAVEELRWNKEAALRGCFDSLWTVRTFCECREGVKLDLVEAYAWLSLYEDTFTRAKLGRELWSFQLSQGISKYKTSSLDVVAMMSASEIEQARQLYRELIKHRIKWIRKKANEGSTEVQYDLGWCYREGYAALQDNAEAVRWWQMAAEQGNTIAQYNLGLCLRDGDGVEIDWSQAYAWFQLAGDQGNKDAKENAAALANLMSAAEIDEADRLYQQFRRTSGKIER